MDGRTGGIIGACVAFTLIAWATAVTAGAPSPDDSARGKEWIAMASAYGDAIATQDGGTVEWSGAILAGFNFTVDEAGLAAGEWVLAGSGTQTVSVPGVEAVGDLNYEGGGVIGGDESVLVATGSATTTGVVQPIGLEVNNTSPIPPLGIDVDVFCNEMWGTWDVTVGDAFEDEGFDTAMDGTFVGHVRFEGFSDEALDELTNHGFSMDTLNQWSGDYSLVERVEFEVVTLQAHVAALAAASERLVATYPDWSGPDAYAVVDQIHILLNVLRNLSGCTRAVLGEDTIELWTDSLHGAVRRVIAKLVDLNLFPGAPAGPQGFDRPAVRGAPPPAEQLDLGQATLAFQQLVDFALRSAVIGAGALDPAQADEAERALVGHGSQLLDALELGGGTDDDRRRVLFVGALMGWEFDVGGESIDPASALAELGIGS